jgi:thiamine biosynthesis lipoprotein
MNRRDFLHPRQVARSAGQVLASLHHIAEVEPDAPCSDVSLLRLSRRAMATTFEVVVPFGTPDPLDIGETALDLIDALEDQLTVYRDHSEVCRLNRLASSRPIAVESGLFDLLRLAARISDQTDGAFDVTAGSLVKLWGFFRGPRRVPSPAEIAATLQQVGMNHVELDEQRQTIRYYRPGLEINLGSIGKGYALDRVTDRLRTEWNLPGFLVQGGHSSVFAHGHPPGEPRGWQVQVCHPWNPGQHLARLWLHNRGLGTSAATFQYLEYAGQKYGHVLDPRTGWPASGVASATVIAPTSAEADALSTAFFILGTESARQYCEQHGDIGAILLPDGEAEPVVIGRASCELSEDLGLTTDI